MWPCGSSLTRIISGGGYGPLFLRLPSLLPPVSVDSFSLIASLPLHSPMFHPSFSCWASCFPPPFPSHPHPSLFFLLLSSHHLLSYSPSLPQPFPPFLLLPFTDLPIPLYSLPVSPSIPSFSLSLLPSSMSTPLHGGLHTCNCVMSRTVFH